MYDKIKNHYITTNKLDFQTIYKTFCLEDRTDTDLKNLKEYIIRTTLTSEKEEFEKHAKQCNLMSLLIDAIDQELNSRY